MSLIDRDIEIERKIALIKCEHRATPKKLADGSEVCPLCGEITKPASESK